MARSLLREGEDPFAACEEAMVHFLSGREGMKDAEQWLYRFIDTRHAPEVLLRVFSASETTNVRPAQAHDRGGGGKVGRVGVRETA
jgi:hypothetical protein